MTTFAIPAQNIFALKRKVEKLARKAAKLGLPPVVLTEIERRSVSNFVGFNALLEPVYRTVIYVDVQISGTSPKIAGWTLSAAIDFVEGGSILREVPGETIPESFRRADRSCQHCNSKRIRRNVFICRNVETGEFKQVGRQCVADFLGHPDAEQFAQMAENIRSIQDACGEAESFGYGSGERAIYVPAYLEYVACAIRLHGWKSATAARDGNGEATCGQALDFMYPPKGCDRSKIPTPNADDVKLAADSLKWLRETLPAKLNRSNFEHNLLTLAANDDVDRKHIGFVAAIVRCYVKSIEDGIAREQKARERAAENGGTSNYIGTIGARQTFNVRVLALVGREGTYGLTTIVIMADEAGNKLTWFASGEPGITTSEEIAIDGGSIIENRFHAMERGHWYRIKATVKKHDLYEGQKVTYITRAKVEAEIKVEVAA